MSISSPSGMPIFRTGELLGLPIDAFSCKSRSQRRPSPRLSASLGPPFTALSRQGGYAHILKGYFYTNLVGTLLKKFPACRVIGPTSAIQNSRTTTAR